MKRTKIFLLAVSVLILSGCSTYPASAQVPHAITTTVIQETGGGTDKVITTTTTTSTPQPVYVQPYVAPQAYPYYAHPSTFYYQPRYNPYYNNGYRGFGGYGSSRHNGGTRFYGGLSGTVYW